MNGKTYRLVYSRLRGMLVAVEEIATATGKQAGEATVSSRKSRSVIFSLRQIAFATLALFGALPSLSGAQIVPGGAHAPSVIQTQNGLDQVNINRPSGAGVSMNTYGRFDVQQKGAVLNNSPVIVQTQQAGMINGNPNFAPGQSARVIVNQVSSSAASQINGHLEVAGQRAEVVIANGSGISVNGGGFVNTSRVILTTGAPNFAPDGSLSGFNVTGGAISIQGAGLNAGDTDQVDLLSRAVQANAAIYAKNLNVVAGANSIEHDTLRATPIAGDGPAPGVSIDVSQFGGMYANRIVLVGTENGVGVSNKGVLAAQAGDLVLSTNGLLTLAGQTNASGTISLSARDGIDNSGTTYARQNVTANTSGALTNSGVLAAQQNTNVSAGSVASTGTLGAGVNGDGTLSQSGDLSVTAGGTLSATGRNAAGGNAALNGAALNLAGSSTSANRALGLTARSGDLSLSGATATAGGALDMHAAGSFDNSHGDLSADQLALHATNLVNHGGSITQTGTGAMTVDVTGTLDNRGGTLQTNSDGLAVGAAALVNDNGTIASSGTGTLSVNAGSLSNNGGTIATNGMLDVRAGATSNRGGTIAAQTGATLNVASLDNSVGGYVGAHTVSLTDMGALDNAGGTIQADGTLLVSAQSVANDGGSIANGGTGATTVAARGAVTNMANGLIGGNGDVSLSGGSIGNAGGTVTAAGAATVQSGSMLDNRAGLIQGSGNVSVSAHGTIDNTGGQIEADATVDNPTATLAVTGASLDNTNGRIANTGSGATTVSAAIVTNSNTGGVAGAGTIGGNGDVAVSAGTLSNTNGAQLVSGHDLALNIARLADNTNATLSGANNVTLNGPNAGVINAGGSIHGNGAIALNAASLDNTSGRIGNDPLGGFPSGRTGSGGSVSVTVGTLANQNGAIGSDQNLSVTTNQLTGDGRIIAGNDGAVTVNSDYTLTGANHIQANHDLTFTTAGTFTNQGTLGAVNALTVNAANVDNQAGADINSTSTTVNAANAISNEGRIEGDSVTMHSASLINTATIIGNMVTLNAGSIANTGAAAVMAAASQLNLYSPGNISNTGGANIFSLGDINIAADDTRDANGLLTNRSHSVTNDQSTIEAQGNIEVATQTLTNTRPAPTVETVTTDVDTVHQTKRDAYMACTTAGSDKGYCTQDMWNNGYLAPLNTTFSVADVVSQKSGPNAADKVLVVNVNGQPQTIWYNTLTTNTDGTISVSYWDGYDPNVNYDPATEYASRNDAHKGYQRVEIARDTTTTTQQDQVTGPQAQQAQLMAGGNMVLANVGALNNEYSAIGAGGSIQIGSADATGDVASGNYGGTLLNNIGQTLYQYQKQDIVSTYAWNENISRDVGTVVEPSIVLSPVAIGGTGGTIIANNAVQINATDINNNNVAAANSATGATGGTLGANGTVGGITGRGAQTVNLATGQIQTIKAPQSIAGPGGVLNITLPSSGLYTFNTAPGASYLVVTDPRLTSYTSFISSDYMLGALGLDPSKIIKRLGDGVYEEQMVRNQITQLTGRVYLQGYTSNEDEYRALMNNGVNVAKEFSLEPGLALSAAQMDALTSDIVWLVSQTVTLPDGSTQQVLAPVVYLAHAHASDLQPTGALIAADDVEIHATGSVTNSGVIRGGAQTVVGATNILNRGGSIGSSTDNGTTVVSATNDVVNASGRITGNRVAVLAGHDIVNTTLLDTVGMSSVAGNSKVSQSLLGAQGTIVSTGDLLVVAGNDVAVHGASIAAGGNTQIAAGHDITVDTVQSDTQQSVTKNADHHWEASSTMNQTGAITAGGSLAMQSGNDTTLKGATVSAGGDMAVIAGGNLTATTVTNTATYNNVATDDKTRKQADRSYDEQTVGTTISAGGNATLAALSADPGKGNVTLTGSSLAAGSGAATIAATGNVDINEGREEHDSYSATQSKRGSFVHGSTTDTMQSAQANIGVGSTVSGDTVTVSAGKDLSVKGSTIAGTNDVNLAAAGNVNIMTSQDTQSTSSYYQKHESGFGTGGGIGISVGSKTQTDTASTTQVTNTGSTVGSLDGSLNVTAGKDLHVTGSDLVAAQNVTGTGANVRIDSAVDTMHHDEKHEVKQSGFTLAIKAPVIDAISNAVDQAHAASHSQDDRAAALHGMAAASSAVDALGAGGAAAGALANGAQPEAKIELSYGSSHSENTYSEGSATNRGSNVTAGGTAAFVATGNGASGSSTGGSGNVTIAGSNVNASDVILAAKNQVNLVNTTDTDSTRSTNQSSSASVGISYGTSGFGVDASMSKAHGNSNGDTAIQNNTHVTAANTATIISGGDTNIIGANVSGNQVNADIGGNLNIASVQDTMTTAAHQESTGGGFAVSQGGGSASFSHTNANANGSYAGVNEQAGIQAGDGGFNIRVKGNTDLHGAVIASDADASKNTLSTGTLTYSDIQNSSSYNAHTGGISGGVTTGDGGANYSTTGATSGKNAGGVAPMLSQNDSGSDRATTKSGVSAGTISVTNADHQTQDIASLNRDTSNTNGTVAKLPDVNNLLDRQGDMMAAAGAAGEAVSRRIGDFAQSKYDEAKNNGDQAGMEAWKEGGVARAEMQAAGAALVTGLAGGNAIGGAAGAGIASIAAGKLNELSGTIAGSNPTGNASMNEALGNIVANAIATGAGGAIGGDAGAFSGYNVDRFNRQLHQPEKTKAQQIAAAAKDQGLTNPDGSPITAAQIENAMRGANNSQYGEIAATGVFVPLNASTPAGAVYDTAGMKLVTDSTGNYLVQDPSMLAMPSKTVQDLITQNTGGASSPYSWGTSTAQTAAPKIDPYGPFSPTFNTGDYSAGFSTAGRGVAGDYATVNVGSLSGNVTGAVNLYDHSLYVGGSVVMANPSSIAFTPGISGTVGYIIGKNSAQGTRDFLAGDGIQGFVSIPTPFGFNAIGAVTHAYDGATAIEFGVGQPGSVSFGISPWGHTRQVTGKTQ
ncbi:hemagglutinin repeat-containing protein [Paraburkholderia caffeinilytica]|uniref:hemagglutinin repeat-containing protein n=1 Tax=Paraburkholderia caffeinilytica TaxID=1761016 RepID=UPI0038BBEBE6